MELLGIKALVLLASGSHVILVYPTPTVRPHDSQMAITGS